MKWLGRAVACGSWVEVEEDLACNEAYWSLCFKLGLFRRTLRALRQLPHCVGSSDSLPAFRVRDSRNLQFATRVPSAPAGQTLHEWRRERSWRPNSLADRLWALAQGLQRATAMEGNASFLNMPPNFQARDPDFAQRFKLLAPRLQLNVRCNVTHTLPRALTFDMRGD